jgi:hypothetical protein
MNQSPQNPSPPPSLGKNGWGAFILLSLVLGLLFWRSFLPGVVHFSNDGPLGAQMGEWLRVPESLTGMWHDQNSIGASAGTRSLTPSSFLTWILGPVAYSKYYPPIVLLFLGLGAWAFYRQLGLRSALAVLAAVATALNTAFLSTACWGVGSQQLCYAMIFAALALVTAANKASTFAGRWVRLALAGASTGMAVMEGADIGAIFSMLLAAYVVYEAAVTKVGGVSVVRGAVRGALRVALIAAMAGFLAAQFVDSLVNTYIKGVAIVESEERSPEEKWNWATQWSQPKVETLALLAPGLFGYRMDTPGGGNYWGRVGSDPSWDRWLAGDESGGPPRGVPRFIGSSPYGGILVLLVALWTVTQALRREGSPFSGVERRLILFWGAVMGLALLFAWGRFAPFYQFLYALPYFSSIRNPVKFMFVLNFAMTILFAYGLKGLWTRHVAGPDRFAGPLGTRFKRWRASLVGADRNWAVGCLVGLVLLILATIIYTGSRSGLERYLAEVGFEGAIGTEIAAFSIREAWISLGFLVAALGVLFLTLSGAFAGARAGRFAVVVGVFLLVDLGRAAQPYIIHVDYAHKYDLNLKNPVIEFLKQRPYEQRVAILPFPMPEQFELLGQVYRIEWAQHHFPYHNIQSLDIIQMPRMPADLEAFEKAWSTRGTAGLLRRWELTNTRYLIGPAGFSAALNEQVDPEKKRFSVKLPFALANKPGVLRPTKLEDFTAVENPQGPNAIIEFRGALPRAKLYSRWQINTNDAETLAEIFRPEFDPQSLVLVANPDVAPGHGTNATPGTVEFASYAPKRIVFNVNATEPAVLLLNDRYDKNWKVFVSGEERPLLRCNFIMRGVQVPPGQHTVEFVFRLPVGSLYITLAAFAVTLALLALLFITRERGGQREEI